MKMNEELIESLYDQVNKNPHKVLYISVILQALLDLLKVEREEEASSITLEKGSSTGLVLCFYWCYSRRL